MSYQKKRLKCKSSDISFALKSEADTIWSFVGGFVSHAADVIDQVLPKPGQFTSEQFVKRKRKRAPGELYHPHPLYLLPLPLPRIFFQFSLTSSIKRFHPRFNPFFSFLPLKWTNSCLEFASSASRTTIVTYTICYQGVKDREKGRENGRASRCVRAREKEKCNEREWERKGGLGQPEKIVWFE